MKKIPFFPALLLLASAVPALSDPVPPPAREISMRESVERALGGSIDIAVSLAESDSEGLAVPMEEAAFLPRFTAGLSLSRSLTPSGSTLAGTLSIDQRAWEFDAAAEARLRHGGTLSLSFEGRRQEATTAISLLSPEYSSDITLRASQPLLKRFGRDVALAPLRIARAGGEAATGDWLSKVMDIVAAARISFLAFHAASREVEVREAAHSLALRLRDRTAARIEAGAQAPSERLPAEAAVASRKEELLRAEAKAQNAADDLKNLFGLRSEPDWEERLIPVPPREDLSPPGGEDTYEEALRRRPEVRALSARTLQAEVREAAARNGLLPELTITASAGLSGLSGSPNPNPFFPGGGEAFEGDYGDSVGEMLSGRYYNWFIGLSTEIPWEFRRERAEWARARRALDRQRLLEEALRAEILREVRKARRDLASSLARVSAAAASAEAARVNLEAVERRHSLGAATTTEVLESQQDHAQALLAEVSANTDAHASRTRLWRAVGTILEREGIVIR